MMSLQRSRRISLKLSTTSSGSRCLSLISADEFSARKSTYDKKLTDLRKQWTAEYRQQQDLAREKKRQETERIILQKAIRLRSKREDSSARNALKKLNNERADFYYREHIAKLKVVRGKKAEVQKKRFESLVRSLEAESKYWVTPANMDTKITEELFTKPCTTGVVTKSSEFWRTYARCTNINRLLFGVLPNLKDEDTINDVILERTQAERATKEDIMDTLNSMIGTGEDREKFEELVEDFSSFTGTLGGTSRKPVNFNVTPDFDKMKKDDFLNLFERGENEYEDRLLREKVDELMAGNEQSDSTASSSSVASGFEEDSDSDLHISENEFHVDDEMPTSISASAKISISQVEELEVENFSMEEEDVELYASAEPSVLTKLLEDLEYVDTNDEEMLLKAYEKIKSRMLNKSRI